jgi:ABC-type transporter Mla subunit MlaD
VRRLLAVVVIVGAAAAAVLLTGASEQKGKRTYKIVFDNAFGLTEGGDFRVAGVKAGKTSKFSITKDKPPKAEVTAELTEPGFGDLRSDARCSTKPQSLIGEYYVDCQPGTRGKKLPTDGTGTVGVKNTESTIPPDLVNDIMRRPYRDRLRLIINTLGAGLAGRPADLRDALRRAHPGLRETSRTLEILGRQNTIIENFIADSDTVVAELERNKQDVSRFIEEAGDAAEISATRRADIAASFRKLPGFLDELRPTMARLSEVADEQVPLLTDLQRAAPDLDTFFTRLGPFSEASRPAIRSLGRASRTGTRALREGQDEIAELKALAPLSAPTGKPLRQFLQTMDDRKRAVEDDPRGSRSAPPAPDKTAEGTGFTGFEAIWNYPFWQTLSLNAFDQVGHMLRVSLTVSKCAEYVNDPAAHEEDVKDCNQWLGPYQPGINQPDFTDGSQPRDTGGGERRAARDDAPRPEAPAKEEGERRGPGEPDAGPRPGQPDISKPQIVLPPQVQDLLDRVAPRQLPKAPTLEDLQKLAPQLAPDAQPQEGGGGGGTPEADKLLDYLLGG